MHIEDSENIIKIIVTAVESLYNIIEGIINSYTNKEIYVTTECSTTKLMHSTPLNVYKHELTTHCNDYICYMNKI